MTTFNPQGPLAGKSAGMPAKEKRFWTCCKVKDSGERACRLGHYVLNRDTGQKDPYEMAPARTRAIQSTTHGAPVERLAIGWSTLTSIPKDH